MDIFFEVYKKKDVNPTKKILRKTEWKIKG